MTDCGPGTTVYDPPVTKTRSAITVIASDTVICETGTSASALETVISNSEIIISGRAVRNSIIRRVLRVAGNNRLRYGNDCLHIGNGYLRTGSDHRCCGSNRFHGGEDRLVDGHDR